MRTLFIVTGKAAVTRHIGVQDGGEFAGVGVVPCLVRKTRLAQTFLNAH